MTSHPFGTGWRFGPASAGGDQPEFDDSGFAEVTLPHTVTPLSWQDWDPAAWERVWMYRRRFDAPHGGGPHRPSVHAWPSAHPTSRQVPTQPPVDGSQKAAWPQVA